MKKLKTLSITTILLMCILCIIIGILLTICGGFFWVYNTPTIKEAFVQTYNNENNSSPDENNSKNINSDTVELNVPKEFLNLGEEEFNYKLTKEQKSSGFIDVKKNKDGSATYTIKRKDYEKFISELNSTAKRAINELSESGAFKSVKSIIFNKDLSEITITADKKTFENNMDSMVVMSCGISSIMYQMFDVDSSRKCTIEVKDSTTGEVFQTTIYPDALNTKK